MVNESKILVYHHQPHDEPIVRKGLGIMRFSEFETLLEKESQSLQFSTKLIPSGAMHVEITPRSLLTEEQLKTRATKPNDDSSIASVRLPAAVFLARATVGNYGELYIVSRKQEEVPQSVVL
ncbi:hypothetical protein Slin15195_G026190 [Septoria linicola]|uniref:Uncharacterized protein n=1 Tax=Septoria linicola TaxID=215465 RepID=A0A9Q9AMT0_9PEZI|nr:hypothetical protein Slin14017_G025250 [Septoria linicola]USW49300.1 hypothetical protein Slin15195_G026190 [Septoria linicola]